MLKNKKASALVIVVILILIIVIGLSLFFYFKHTQKVNEVKNQTEEQKTIYYVESLDENTNKRIGGIDVLITKFENGKYTIIGNLTTNEDNLEAISLPVNTTYAFFYYKNHEYYMDKNYITPNQLERFDVSFMPHKISDLDLLYDGKLELGEITKNITIVSENQWREPDYCLDWSSSVITAKLYDETGTELVENTNIAKYPAPWKCYYGGQDIINSSRTIKLFYKLYQFSQYEYIKVSVIDSGRDPNDLSDEFVLPKSFDNKGNDLGGINREFQILP